MKNERLSASEARRIAENTDELIKDIYTRIRYGAKEGEVSLSITLTSVSGVLLHKVITTLRCEGYTVTATGTAEHLVDKGDSFYVTLNIAW